MTKNRDGLRTKTQFTAQKRINDKTTKRQNDETTNNENGLCAKTHFHRGKK